MAETRRLQRSLASAASLLEQRARERDEEIRRTEAARVEAEQANKTKDQFLAVLGHELRNPLAPALTALELMRTRDPNVFKREREVLQRQVTHMTRLVNDLLDVSRLTRGKTELDRSAFRTPRSRRSLARHGAAADRAEAAHAKGIGARAWPPHQRRHRSHRPGAVESLDQCRRVHLREGGLR